MMKNKIINNEKHPLSGKTVKIKSGEFKDQEYTIEDYWDRVSEISWMYADGNPACLIYAIRAATNNLPEDDNVLYGKIGCLGHLVHVSELGEEVK